ncbi:MAG: D-alanyl-D-alanine carboxypeptidase [Firmicutes bacterium]|nr:D-alanyl-D-alanine carboxypeptidase [Bacillota bacterium]
MLFKRLIGGILTASILFSALPAEVFAVPSGSAIEYDDDDEDERPARRRNNDDDEDNTGRGERGDEQFRYAEETTTEPTTVSIVVDQSGVSTPDGITANINIMAEGAALIDAKTGMLLYGKHAEQRMYPASMTKVMTLLVACESGKLDDIVTVSDNAVNSIPWDSSKADLVAGEEISLRDLLYGLILVSGNDAAVAIAEHVGGSEEAFVELMNKKAEELGCENTHFVNPHGYHDEQHYTTPHDMALIVRAAAENENAVKIMGSSDHSINATNKHEARVLNHSDKMLQPTTQFYDERIKGGKTGFHNQAMNTLASYAENGDISLAAVIMKDNGYNPTYEDTKTLLDYGFGLYKERVLYGRDRFERIVPVIQYYKDEVVDLGTVSVTLANDLTAYTPSFINEDTVVVNCDMPEELAAPIAADQVVGTVTVSYAGAELGKIDIIPANAVDAIPEKELARQRRHEAFVKVMKVIGISVLVIALALICLIFGLRAWFISQKKRKGAKKRKQGNNGGGTSKKKKIKIKLK